MGLILQVIENPEETIDFRAPYKKMYSEDVPEDRCQNDLSQKTRLRRGMSAVFFFPLLEPRPSWKS